MPIYSPVGYLDITNATLRTSNLEAQNLRINGGNIYVTSEITTNSLLNLETVTNYGNVTSNTVQFSNAITSLTAASNIVVTGNVTAATFIGSGAALTSIPPSAITGTLSQWSDGTNSDVYIASNVGIGNVHTLTSNTLQVGANLYVRDVDANVLTVTGNVAATYFEGDGSKLTGISATLQAITDAGNVTTNTLEFTNATTGFVTTSNIEVGGTLKINTITAAAYHSLQAVTNVGNVTSDTVQFSNATTSLTADSNIVVTGNVTAATFLGDGSGLTALNATNIASGTLDVARIPALDTAKITTGTLDAARIPALDTAKITTGTLDAARIPTLNQNTTGSAATLTTPRSIGGVNFDGSAAIVPTTFNGATFNGDVGIGTTSPGAKFTLYGDDTQDEGGLLMKVVDRIQMNNGFTGIGLGGYATTSAPIIQVAKSAIIHERTGYNGTGNLMFCNDDTTDNNDVSNTHARMTIMGDGNVGIGVVDPQYKLDINGTTQFRAGQLIRSLIANNVARPAITDTLQQYEIRASAGNPDVNLASGHGFLRIGAGGAMASGGYISYIDLSGYSSVADMKQNIVFGTSSAERMRITHDGNVGIGTTSPLNILHLSSDNTSLDASDLATFDQYSLIIHNTRGSGSDDTELGLCFSHFNTSYPSSTRTPGAAITHERTTSWSKGKLHFKTKSDATEAGSCDTRMTIDDSGNVGIGRTDPSKKLDVNGHIKCSALITGPNSGYWTKMYIGTGSTSARLYLRGTGDENHVTIYAAGSSFSDDRLKTDEELITDATDTLMKLSVQKYKKYDNFDLTGSYKNETGLIAQDIWYNAPELRHIVDLGADASGNKVEPLPLPGGVNTTHDIQNDPDYNALGWGDDEAGVLYAQLIPYLIKSNQEIYTELQAEKAKVTTLETQLISVLTRLDALENA